MSGLHAREFLVANDLIGHDPWDTVERVLTWSRRLNHAAVNTVDDQELLFGVRGLPPAYLMALGTESAQPEQDPGSFRHFTSGCWGTQAFLRNVLRAANISVETGVAYTHAAPVFVMPEGRYHLTHADHLYFSDWFQLGPVPTSALLIPARQQRLYFAKDSSSTYLERSEFWLYTDYFAGSLMTRYCGDIAAGLVTPAQRANGSVSSAMAPWYAAADLERSGFWDRLGAHVSAHGGCPAASEAVFAAVDVCAAADFAPCMLF
jgi:hypothetical protein